MSIILFFFVIVLLISYSILVPGGYAFFRDDLIAVVFLVIGTESGIFALGIAILGFPLFRMKYEIDSDEPKEAEA